MYKSPDSKTDSSNKLDQVMDANNNSNEFIKTTNKSHRNYEKLIFDEFDTSAINNEDDPIWSSNNEYLIESTVSLLINGG